MEMVSLRCIYNTPKDLHDMVSSRSGLSIEGGIQGVQPSERLSEEYSPATQDDDVLFDDELSTCGSIVN